LKTNLITNQIVEDFFDKKLKRLELYQKVREYIVKKREHINKEINIYLLNTFIENYRNQIQREKKSSSNEPVTDEDNILIILNI
jgi:hypothetical protein